MSSSPLPAKLVKVIIDKERSITFNNRAEFRMGSLDRPFLVMDLKVKKRSWAALVAWVWACLSERDALDFDSPERLSEHMQSPEVIAECFKAFVETWTAAQEPEAGTKNG